MRTPWSKESNETANGLSHQTEQHHHWYHSLTYFTNNVFPPLICPTSNSFALSLSIIAPPVTMENKFKSVNAVKVLILLSCRVPMYAYCCDFPFRLWFHVSFPKLSAFQSRVSRVSKSNLLVAFRRLAMKLRQVSIVLCHT